MVPLALAQATPHDPPDLAGYVTDGPVYAVAHEPGGDTYIGGEFSHVGPASGHGLALGAVGSADEGVPFGSAAADRPLLGDADFPHVGGGEVHAAVPDQHGGWFIGGDFTSVGGLEIPRLAHINPGGTVDAEWVPAPNSSVLALALDSTTSADKWALYAGGKFTQVAGSNTRHFLAAWHIDGTTGIPAVPNPDDDDPDPSDEPLGWRPGQPVGTGGGDVVRALAVTTVEYEVGTPPDTMTTLTPVVFAGGDFVKLGSETNSATHNKIGAVWGDGARKADDTPIAGQSLAWTPSAGTNAADRVHAIALGTVQDTGTAMFIPVYYGGTFTINGTNLTAYQLKVTKETGAVGPATTRFTGWNPSPSGPGGVVRGLSVADDETVYAGGEFTTVGPSGGTQPRRSLAAFAGVPEAQVTAGSACTATTCPATIQAWNPGPVGGEVRALVSSPTDDVVYAGGNFAEIGDGAIAAPPERNGLAAVAGAGQPNAGAALDWDARPAGGAVNALALAGDALYAGGGFFSVLSEERKNLAALDPDGTVIEGFTAGVGCAPAPCRQGVHALALAPDVQELYVGGEFSEVDSDPGDELPGTSRRDLAALDTATGSVVPDWDPQPHGEGNAAGVLALDVAGDRLYVGGMFDRIGSPETEGDPQPTRRALAAVDRNTGDLLDWDTNVRCVAIGDACSSFYVEEIEASCESVYVGGNFDRIGAVAPDANQPTRNDLAELDPETAAATDWDPDPTSVVRAIEVAEGGAESGDGEGEAIVYVGGQFAQIGNVNVPNGRGVRSRIAAIRASDGSVTNWNPDADSTVRALALSGDEQALYAGGSFNSIGGASRSRLAALEADGVGTGNGDATAWDPSAHTPDPAARSAIRSIAVAGDNAYAGGEQTDVGAYAQRGYAQFTSEVPEEPSTEPVACEPPAPSPDTTPPEISSPSATDAGQTMVLTLSEPADVHIDLTGTAPGLRPLRGRTCIPDTPANRKRLRLQLARKLGKGKRAKRRATRGRRRGRQIAKRRCTRTLTPPAIDAEAASGENRISLAGAGPLQPGFYRAVIAATDEAGNAAVPYSIDFEVAK